MFPIFIRALRISALVAVGTVVFEVAKHSVYPGMSIRQSDAITIVFVTLTSLTVGIVILRREARSRCSLLRELEKRKVAEEKLRLQATTLDAAANGIVITNRAGNILWVNKAFTKLTGYAAEEVLGHTPRFLRSDRHDSKFYEDLWRTIASGSAWQGEVTNRRKDGTLYPEEMTITPVRAESGEIDHFIAIKVDATERRQAEECLRRSESSLRSMVQHAPYGISRSSAKGKILSANPAFCKMLGYDSEEELLQANLQTIYSLPWQRNRLMRDVIHSGEMQDAECQWKRRDGTEITVRVSSHTLPGNDDGDLVFEDYVEDITERRRDELELHRLNRSLTTLSKCNEALVHAKDEAQLLQQICNLLVQVGGFRLAWVGYAEGTQAKPVRVAAKAGWDDGYLEVANISWDESERGQGPVGRAIKTGNVQLLRNVQTDPDFSFWRKNAVRRGYASVISLPLLEGGIVIGALSIYSAEPDAFDQQEVDLLKELAADLSYGIISLRNAERSIRAEIALRESEERYRFMFVRNPHPMWICDVETRAFLDVNEAALAQYGYSREELLSLTLDDIRPVEEIPKLHASLAQAQEGYTFNGQSHHRKKDGSIISVEIAAYRFQEQGRLLALALATDVTERMRAEQALRASETRYRMLFEHNLAAVFHSSDDKLLDCNEAMCRMFGYDREEMKSLDLRTLYRDFAVQDAGQKLLRTSGRLANYQVELLRKDGKAITVLANLNLLREEHDPPVVVGVMLDITEVHKLQEQLAQSQKLEALGKLTGGIAHDFNNILMIINSYSELLLDKIGDTDPLRRPIEQIRAAGTRAASLTAQLLAFSRKQVMAPIVLKPGNLLRDLKDMLRRLLGEDIQLETAVPNDLWLIQADPTQMEQVIINLCVNARDAMPGGGQLSITAENVRLSAEFVRKHPGSRGGEYVALTIADNGCGMTEAVKVRIFEPFFTTKEPGKGTGLGLSTVYGIVKQSGGYITVESEVGNGTRFCVYLPRCHEELRMAEAPEEVAAALNATVLVVEDEEPTREAIGEYLRQNGFRVVTAGNGEEAIRASESYSGKGIDVLLTDVIMPGMNGKTLADTFRERYPTGKVVFMSGYTEEILSRTGMPSAEVSVLAKPFRLSDLVIKIRGTLEGSRSV